jgi:hypothetical protein
VTRPIRLHLEDRLHLVPDWVIVGVPYPADDGAPRVLLVASKSLDRVILTHRAEELVDIWEPLVPSSQGYTLTAELDNAILATGANYAEAFGNLLKSWDPDQPDGRAFNAIENLVESEKVRTTDVEVVYEIGGMRSWNEIDVDSVEDE